jgi:hypothetical protein
MTTMCGVPCAESRKEETKEERQKDRKTERQKERLTPFARK